MNLQVFTARKHFSASVEETWKRFLSRVYPDVIDELVLGFERFELATAVLPKTRIIRLLRSAHVIDADVRHEMIHRCEDLITNLLSQSSETEKKS